MPFLHVFSRLAVASSCLLVALFFTSCKTAKSKRENFLTSYSYLQQEKKLKSRIVYADRIGELTRYDKIHLEEVTVYPPEKNPRGKVTQADLQRIRDLFEKSLRTEIGKGQLALVNEPGPQTLALRAGVFDPQPGKPAVFALGYAPYVGLAATATKAATDLNMGAGSATIEMELLDSLTREQLFAIVDEDVGSKLQIIKGMSRWGHIEAALQAWSKELRERLRAAVDAQAAADSSRRR